MLSEARIILPWTVRGKAQMDIHAETARMLINRFGGYTKYTATGGWKDNIDGAYVVEPVVVYDVATDASSVEDYEDLWKIASRLGALMEQREIYLRDVNGTVHMVPPDKDAVYDT